MASFELAFEQVQQLVNTFQQNYNHYMSAGYSESAARTDFIDKFFTALGWDVSHTTQTNPYEQEVKIEKSQSQQNESARKRADYAFYTAPNFKDEVFFCEAKKPSVLINQNPQHYFQTIKYGWNSGCPISVLTDFEELVIIDCRNKPDLKFALNGKHKTYRFTDYAVKEKFAEIYWLFSREAVGNNSLHKYAEQLPKAKGKVVQKALFKGGYQAIDDSFLEYIDAIRENIAKAFKKANSELNSEQLTEATQRTVDRLVFIRFLEDKFIEAEEHVSKWQSWKDFITDCRKLDAKYNGVVFKKHFIDEADFIGADEKLFLDICSDISNLNSPYDFNYIPIHILGSIYERFLGKIVRATDKRVFVEEKPEVRKAGGVYYTPKYIVDYIVQNTVGKIIDGLTPKQIAEKRFADIACGSGSFLIGVYDYLLDYHKKYYVDKLKDKTEIDGRSEDYGNVEYKDRQWLLTLKLKQDILINNIYGVDIDAQAVEVTQLSLFLKMLEEENVSSTQIKQGALFSKVLPDLSKNIVCGNSLIGWDIMKGQLFENDELKKLNPMDYDAVFPAIIRNGGFDAVVGNPPYGALFSDQAKAHLKLNYQTFSLRGESYVIFIEKAIKKLKQAGKLGVIIPDTYLNLEFTLALRRYLLSNTHLEEIVMLPSSVFAGATVDTTILICSRDSQEIKNENRVVQIKKFPKKALISQITSEVNSFHISIKNWQDGKSFNVTSTENDKILIERIESQSSPLSQYSEMFSGIKSYEVGKGNPKQTEAIREKKPYTSIHKEEVDWEPLYDGKHIGRYETFWNKNNWIKYGPWLAAPREPENFIGEKLFIRKIIGKTLVATYISETCYCNTLLFVLKLKNKDIFNYLYLLGILNSSFIGWLFRKKFQINEDDTFPQIMIRDILQFPIPVGGQQIQENLNLLVTQMLDTKQQLATTKTDTDKNFLQNKCASLDRQIDNLVFALYGLTEEEIKIVEE